VNRRKFFKWLGVGAAIAVAAPYADTVMGPACVAPPAVSVAAPAAYATYVMGQDAIINSYRDYVNFSDLAITSAIDESVERVNAEFKYRTTLSLRELVKNV
jgi:hypothetical protein